MSIAEERAEQLRQLLCEKDCLQEESFLQLKKFDILKNFDPYDEELILIKKRRCHTSKYILKICDFKQTGDYENDDVFHMLLSELEEIDEEYRNLRYADGLLYSC
jgi:hypothetical protein